MDDLKGFCTDLFALLGVIIVFRQDLREHLLPLVLSEHLYLQLLLLGNEILLVLTVVIRVDPISVLSDASRNELGLIILLGLIVDGLTFLFFHVLSED